MIDGDQLIAHATAGHSWHEMGEGDETVLFLHPIVGTSVYWEPTMHRLAADFRCLAWDAPGYRETDPVQPPLAASVTESLISFLNVASIERCHVVGLSLGAMFALHAVSEHPDRFDKMVLADTSAAFGIDPDEWLDDWLGDLRSGRPLTQVVDESITAISAKQPDPALQARIVASFSEVSNDAFETASRCIAEHDVSDRLANITNETLVLVGEYDGETPPDYGRAIADGIPNATFHQMPGVGHLTSIEAPEAFADLVRSFLAN